MFMFFFSSTRSQDPQGIAEGCSDILKQCNSAPCVRGLCLEAYESGYYCDCADTRYTGRDCAQGQLVHLLFDLRMTFYCILGVKNIKK